MVARGDMGVEMDVQRVPAIQKRIIAACNRTHRPVITATQMLNSMEQSSRPTRAEASDVFNAVLDGTDAVMLSGESAIGQFPVEAVTMMREICTEAEAYLKSEGRPARGEAALSALIDVMTEAAVDAACLMTRQLDAALIVVAAASGRPARALANRRPAATILALPESDQIARRLSLCWGVIPVVLAERTTAEGALRVRHRIGEIPRPRGAGPARGAARRSGRGSAQPPRGPGGNGQLSPGWMRRSFLG